MTAIEATRGRFCPCCGNHLRQGFRPGPDGRPDATCPRCRSLERHRFFAVLLGALGPRLTDVGVLLDVSPAKQTRQYLVDLEPRRYVAFDISPARGVDVRGDITSIPLRSGVADLLVCYHVLEHIPDDAAAMRELARVLAPGGLGILQVPWRPGTVTDEDPDAPEEERIRRFGLADHVRYYGDDVEDRLVAAGFDVVRVTPAEYLGVEANTYLGLGHDQSVWLVTPAGAGRTATAVPARTPTPLSGLLDGVVDELARTRAERQQARAEVRRLQAELDALRGAPEPGPESGSESRRRLWRS